MIGPELALSLVATHGLALVAPLALIEGPIITVIAAWLAQQQVLDLRLVLLTVVLADLAGDALLYLAGRGGGRRLMRLLRVREERVEALALRLRGSAAQVLILAKLTHAAGAPVLFAAGAARVPFGLFMLCNLAATLPKTAVFVALGWWFGSSYDSFGGWIAAASVVLVLGVVLAWLIARRSP